MNSKVIILLPVHNRKDITHNFLKCLKEQTYTNYHLILIDDGCIDGTAEMAKALIKNITILKGNGNLWWAGALQSAYKYLKKNMIFNEEDIICMMNDDVLISNNFLEIAVKTFDENEKPLLPSIAIDHLNGKTTPCGVFYDCKNLDFVSTDEVEKINCLSTRGLFLRAVDFLESGGFYPKLLPHYLSDYEFTYRLIRKKKMVPIVNKELTLKFFPEISGFENSANEDKICNYLLDLYSKKNKSNPVHWIVFIFLTSHYPYNFKNIFKILYLNARQITVVLKRNIFK